MSLKIESPRPQQLSRPAAPSQASPAAAKAAPEPSAPPRPISDGFDRAAPSAATQASKGARLEGVGTQRASELGASAPDSTGTSQETYGYEINFGDEIGDPPEEAVAAYPMTNGTTPPKDGIISGEFRTMLDGLVAGADTSNVTSLGDVHKLAQELGRKVERPEDVSQKAVDDYLTEQLLARLASEGIDLGKSLGGKTGP